MLPRQADRAAAVGRQLPYRAKWTPSGLFRLSCVLAPLMRGASTHDHSHNFSWRHEMRSIRAASPASCSYHPVYLSQSRSQGCTRVSEVVSSYTPSLRLLSGLTVTDAPPSPRLLITAVSAAGMRTLSLSEVDALAGLFPADQHTLLRGSAATRERVLDALASHPYVHFGCHGHQDFANPSAGGLALYDGTLTVPELSADPRVSGELAFLAACETAAGGLVNCDEAISIAAALRFTGWRDVIGSLMPTPDSASAAIAKAVFTAAADPRATHVGTYRPCTPSCGARPQRAVPRRTAPVGAVLAPRWVADNGSAPEAVPVF